MKKAVKIARIIIIFAFFIGGGFFSYRIYNRLFTPTSFSITDNALLSATARDAIIRFIEDEADYANKSIKTLAQLLKTRFPFIRQISIVHVPKSLALRIQIHKPLFIINKDLVLLKSGVLEPIRSFKQDAVASLPSISVNKAACSDNRLIPDFYNCLCAICPELLDAYQLVWNNEREVWLKDKKQQRFKVLCDINSIKDKQKLKLCSLLKKEIECKKTFSYIKSSLWVADIRFDNQVIIFSRGGRGHGYNTFT